jgi:uncharacterized membrane protein YhaH (DUF805 family)
LNDVPIPPSAKRRSPILWLLFSLKGRISRGTYWMAYVGLLSLQLAFYPALVATVEEGRAGNLLFFAVLGTAVLFAEIAVAVKRLHDIGYGGFLAIAFPIPLVGLAFSIWVGLVPGTAAPNRYGAIADMPPP